MLQVDILLLYSNKIYTVRDKANISLRRKKKNKPEPLYSKYKHQGPSRQISPVAAIELTGPLWGSYSLCNKETKLSPNAHSHLSLRPRGW